MSNTIQRALWFAGVPLVALVSGVAGSLPVYVMGLVVPVFFVGPLAMVTGALLATLSAGWLANLVSGGFIGKVNGRGRSRLLMIFVVSMLGAVAGFLVGLASIWLVDKFGGLGLASVLAVYLPGVVVFSAATTVATWRLRAPAEGGASPGFAGVAALALSGAWVLFLLLHEGLGPQLGFLPGGFGLFLPLWVIFVASLALAAFGTALCVVSGRRRDEPARDAGLTLLLTGLAPVLIIGVVSAGCELTYCGA